MIANGPPYSTQLKRIQSKPWSVHWNDVAIDDFLTIFDPGDEPKRTTHLMDVNYASTAWDVSVSCGD